ncbi:MAG TPA: hypothetical protein VLD66_02320, partial [Methyloceanibacter sp.]|nr:hypothetical protein [Methyloceanibacter sp.]
RAVFLLVVALPPCGCTDDRESDLAACKVKAIEAYKPENVEVDNPSADYVYYCMLAAGYREQLRETCKGRIGIMIESCWHPKNWWDR